LDITGAGQAPSKKDMKKKNLNETLSRNKAGSIYYSLNKDEVLCDYCEKNVRDAVFRGYFTDYEKQTGTCIPCFIELCKEYDVDVVKAINERKQVYDMKGFVIDRHGAIRIYLLDGAAVMDLDDFMVGLQF
jgi:hypothetical protein